MQEREFGFRGRGDNPFTAAVSIKYPSLVVVLIIVYVVLRVLGGIQRVIPGG